MKILKGLSKVVLSPLNGVSEIVNDLSGANGDDSQLLSILTVGASSAIKGTGKKIVEGIDDVFSK